MMGAFFNWGKQKVAICMSGTATPRWMPVNKDNIVAQVCEGVRTPHAEPVLKTMQEHYPSFPSCQPQHFRRRGNCCYLSGTWEAVKFIKHFMDCKSSVRSRREAKDINIPNTVWDGYRHILWKAGSQKQQFALWVITPEDLTNCSDPRGMGWSCMRWPDCSSSQQPDGTGDQKPVRNPVSCPIKKKTQTKNKSNQANKTHKTTTKPKQTKNTEKRDPTCNENNMHDDILCVIMSMATEKEAKPRKHRTTPRGQVRG